LIYKSDGTHFGGIMILALCTNVWSVMTFHMFHTFAKFEVRVDFLMAHFISQHFVFVTLTFDLWPFDLKSALSVCCLFVSFGSFFTARAAMVARY